MDRDESRWMKIGQAVERACIELPDGYDLEIALERNAGTVRLYLFDSDSYLHDFGGDMFSEQINLAIDAAIKEALKQTGE